MSSLNKIIVKKANLTVDEDIQFGGDKRDPNNEQLNAESISQNVITIDYFEDVLSPSYTCYVNCSDTTNLLSRLPVRGYERLDLTVGTDFGDLIFGDQEGKFNNPLYVTSILDVSKNEGQETFTLKCTSLENLMNETTRCQKKYSKANISSHIRDILTDPKIFNIKKEELEERAEIEKTTHQFGLLFRKKNARVFVTARSTSSPLHAAFSEKKKKKKREKGAWHYFKSIERKHESFIFFIFYYSFIL